MSDILDAAQKQINDAANKLSPPAAAGSAAPPADPTPSTPPPPPDPAPAPPPAPAPVPADVPKPMAPPAGSEPTPEESAFVDKLIHQTSAASPAAPEPLAQSATPSPVEEPPPPPPEPVAPPAEKKPTPPPTPPKKKGTGRGAMIAAVLLLLFALPMGVFFVSQQQKQLTDTRSRAAVAEPCLECNTGTNKCEKTKIPRCSNTLNTCNREGASCGVRAPTATPRPAATSTPRPAATATPKPAAGDTGGDSGGSAGTGGGDRGTVTPSGECSGYSGGTGQCSTTDEGKCRYYNECCSAGKSSKVKATCSGGKEHYTTGPCDQVDAACGTVDPNAPTCQAGWFYWITDKKCHDISQQQNPGGGSGGCTTAGCSNSGNQCVKVSRCSASEVQAGTGFCLANTSDGEFNHSYQDEANSSCKTIQVDTYNADKCAAGITSITPHDGTIIYRPNLSGPGCTGGGGGGGGGGEPTPTTPPQVLQCRAISIYKDGTRVTDYATLRAGDTVVLAVKGDNATKGRFRVNGAPAAFEESTGTNAAGEFTLSFTIPASVPNNSITIEAEVFQNGVWK